MKRLFILAVLSILGLNTINAQVYFQAGAGYSIAAFKQEIYSYGEGLMGLPVLIQNQTDNEYQNVRFSFNQGLHLRAGLGYSFTDLLGLELNADIQKSEETEAQKSFVNQLRNYNLKGRVHSLTISPVLNFNLKNSKFSVFVKPGVILGIAKIEEKHRFELQNSVTESELIMDGGIAAGLNLSAGLSYSLSNMFSVYGEVMVVSMRYKPKYSTIESYSIDGQDAKNNLTTTEYTLSDDYEFPIQNVKPRVSYPFSGIQFNLGVKITPWAKEGKSRMRSSDNPLQD